MRRDAVPMTAREAALFLPLWRMVPAFYSETFAKEKRIFSTNRLRRRSVLGRTGFSTYPPPGCSICLTRQCAAPTRAAAEAAIDVFADKYNAKHDKAVACLTKDREALLAFFDFPAEHWGHLRTSNPIESVFATVRHRTVRTKGALSAKTAKLMVFKLVNAPRKHGDD